MMLAAIVGPVGPAVSIAEGRSEQLVPHVRESARLVMFLYAGYAVAGVAAYILAGMDWFDAVNHAFAADIHGRILDEDRRASAIGTRSPSRR